MLIAHISDFHVFADRPETSLVRPDAAEAARKVVNDMATFSPAIDAVVFTGDLTDGGSPQDYALLTELLSPLAMPIFVVPGNHDKRSTLRAAYANKLPFEPGRFLNYEAEFMGLRILALDTLVDGRIEGRLCPERMAWIERKLAHASNRPTLIAMHHPPFPSGTPALDLHALVEGSARLGELVARQSGPVRILCGHIHRPFHAIWQGAFAAVAGSPAFQISLDLQASDDEPTLVLEPYAYFVHQRDAQGGFTVHTRYVQL